MNTQNNTTSQPFTLTGDWDVQSKALKAKYSTLTDTDLKFTAGGEKELIGRMQSRLKKNHNDVVVILKQVRLETK